MKTVGLIGGLSWQSTVEYYRILNEESNRRLGGAATLESITYSVNLAHKLGLVSSGNLEQLAAEFLAVGKGLEAAGADFAMFCTNTMHIVFDQVEAGLGIPLLHICDPTAEAIKAKGLTKIALLGTPFTVNQPFMKDRFKNKYGIQCLVPTDEDTAEIFRVIEEELTFGVIKEDSRAFYLSVIEKLRAQGAEGVILGCTEIGLLVKQEHTTLPVFDTTELHALAAVDMALA